MRDQFLVPVAALMFAVVAGVCIWLATFSMWTSGMFSLLCLSAFFSILGFIGCVLVEWHNQRDNH
jgi:hypothetical protein